MFAVDHVLVSDALLDAPFCCALSACKGSCCVEGDRGAPLLPEERAELERALPIVGPRLRKEAHDVIGKEGVWEGNEREGYATTTVGGKECVFVVYRKGIAVCAIQEAYHQGTFDWEKPISCHLYPVRVEAYGEGESRVEVLNYESIEMCTPAIPHGRRLGVQLADFLARPLERRYGAEWVAKFRETLRQRRLDVGVGPAEPALERGTPHPSESVPSAPAEP
ncbi:MAG: DUF3109 family protein [Bacteroidota bacterium]